jgi:hypothetical protein
MLKPHSLFHNRQEILFLIMTYNTSFGYNFILRVYKYFSSILRKKVLFDIGIWLWVIKKISLCSVSHCFVFLLYNNLIQIKIIHFYTREDLIYLSCFDSKAVLLFENFVSLRDYLLLSSINTLFISSKTLIQVMKYLKLGLLILLAKIIQYQSGDFYYFLDMIFNRNRVYILDLFF